MSGKNFYLADITWEWIDESDSTVSFLPQTWTPDGLAWGILNPIPPKCQHKWKTTYGLYREYRDCEICKAKWEDVQAKEV